MRDGELKRTVSPDTGAVQFITRKPEWLSNKPLVLWGGPVWAVDEVYLLPTTREHVDPEDEMSASEVDRILATARPRVAYHERTWWSSEAAARAAAKNILDVYDARVNGEARGEFAQEAARLCIRRDESAVWWPSVAEEAGGNRSGFVWRLEARIERYVDVQALAMDATARLSRAQPNARGAIAEIMVRGKDGQWFVDLLVAPDRVHAASGGTVDAAAVATLASALVAASGLVGDDVEAVLKAVSERGWLVAGGGGAS